MYRRGLKRTLDIIVVFLSAPMGDRGPRDGGVSDSGPDGLAASPAGGSLRCAPDTAFPRHFVSRCVDGTPFYRAYGKRACDVGIVLLLLPIAALVVAIAAAMTRLFIGAPILFRQTRVTRDEKLFSLYKLRSMRLPPSDAPTLSDAQRTTAFGSLLRKTSIDEIPQFWNVLRGDMSLVGPRPLPDIYLPRYTAEQRRRHLVPAGITGWAQVSGRNTLSWKDKFDLDVWYVDHQSFWLDLQILWLTFLRIISARDVNAANCTCEEFKGDCK